MTGTDDETADGGCLKGCGWVAAVAGGGLIVVVVLSLIVSGIATLRRAESGESELGSAGFELSRPSGEPEPAPASAESSDWYGVDDVTVVQDEIPAAELSTDLYKRSVTVVVSKCGSASDFESLHGEIRRELSRPIRHSVVVYYYLPGQDLGRGMYARTTDSSLDWGFDYGSFVTGRPPGSGTNTTGRAAWAMDWNTYEYVQICDESGNLVRALPVFSDDSEKPEKRPPTGDGEPTARNLVVGRYYSVATELPFMSVRNPDEDPRWMENMLWTPPGLEFRVVSVDESEWPLWYGVSFDDGEAIFWLNSTALVREKITSHDR